MDEKPKYEHNGLDWIFQLYQRNKHFYPENEDLSLRGANTVAPTKQPIQNAPKTTQKPLWRIGSKILSWIIKNIGSIIITAAATLLATYLAFKFGWVH